MYKSGYAYNFTTTDVTSKGGPLFMTLPAVIGSEGPELGHVTVNLPPTFQVELVSLKSCLQGHRNHGFLHPAALQTFLLLGRQECCD